MRAMIGLLATACFFLSPGYLLAQKVAQVQVAPARAAVTAGESFQFSVTARDADGRTVSEAPVVWIATPFDIAGCDENGLVTTFRPGQVYVIAFVGGTAGLAVLDIAERPPARLSIAAPGGGSVLEGGVLSLDVQAFTEIGDPVGAVPVRWRSQRPEIASVSPGGVVSGKSPGQAAIVAEASGLSASIEIAVRPNPARQILVHGGERPVRTGGHSFKFAARLQEMQMGDAPVLIRVQTKAGHGAGKPTSKIIEEEADRWAFLVKNLGIQWKRDATF